MRVIVIGSGGQLGRALLQEFADDRAVTLSGWARPAHDLTSPQITQAIAAAQPDVVINAAAWTDVDGAEANEDAAYAANALGPHYLAEGCERSGAWLVHVSTNEVFAGLPGRCYREYDLPQPGSAYARSKLAGEAAVAQTVRRHMIVRVAWLFGPQGNNFPAKIISAADRHGQLRVVDDEFGNPTYAPDVAAAIRNLIRTERPGIFHLVNQGRASRYDFARAALALTGRGDAPVTPIPAHEWPRPAPPPPHAVLVNQAAAALGITLRPWEQALAEYVAHERQRFGL